jgi:UDP-N-acetylglucosamine acyltransferase
MHNAIDPSARISIKAELDGVSIGPFAIIEDNVEIGHGTTVGPGVIIFSGTRIGKNNQIGAYAQIGGLPQDLSFQSNTPSYLKIGDNNTIREMATIHRASQEECSTSIGNNNYLMAVSHIAHDCILHNNVILANNSLLAGFVEVMNNAFISGNCAVHQFVKIGRYAMIAGITKLPQDVPPFSLIEGTPGKFRTINSVGLRRGGFLPSQRSSIKKYYKIIYSKGCISDGLKALAETEICPLGKEILDFCQSSKRGLVSSFLRDKNI